MLTLHALTIIVTRPQPQGELLCEQIRKVGGTAIYLPVMDIVPPDDLMLFKQQIATLAHWDYLIFNSPQAVLQSAAAIHAAWPSLPAQLKIVAIGRSTAQTLTSQHLPVHLYPEENWSSEGVLDLPAFQASNGKKIAIICGKGGRELLADELTARGAEVSFIIAYQRILAKIDIQKYIHLLDSHEIDIIICTSNEIMQNLKTLLGESTWPLLQLTPIMVVSERMLHFANKLGLQHIFLAKNASSDAIIEKLAYEKDHLCQMKKIKQQRLP